MKKERHHRKNQKKLEFSGDEKSAMTEATQAAISRLERFQPMRTVAHGDDFTSAGDDEQLLWLRQELEKQYELEDQTKAEFKSFQRYFKRMFKMMFHDLCLKCFGL